MDLLFVNESKNDRSSSTASNTDIDVVAADDDVTSTATERKRNSKRRGRDAATPSLNRPPPDASRSTAAAAAVGQPLTKEVIVERYAELFTGVGRLEGDVHLDIDPTAKPVQMPPRRLPIPIKDEVKRELDEMCKNKFR